MEITVRWTKVEVSSLQKAGRAERRRASGGQARAQRGEGTDKHTVVHVSGRLASMPPKAADKKGDDVKMDDAALKVRAASPKRAWRSVGVSRGARGHSVCLPCIGLHHWMLAGGAGCGGLRLVVGSLACVVRTLILKMGLFA